MKNLHFLVGLAVIAAAAVLVVPTAVAQTQGSGSGGGSTGRGSTGGTIGGGTRGTGTGTTRGTQSPTSIGQDQTPFPTIPRPIYLQGKVVFEDGTPAPTSVVLERICGGRRIPEGYVDTKGRFSFELGRNQGMMADASIGSFDAGNLGSSRSDPFGQGSFGASGSQTRVVTEKDLLGCELQARLAGYRSTSVELSGRSVFDRPDVGTLVLRKLGDVEGLTISMTSMEAPKKAKKAFNNGLKNARKQKFDKARPEFEKAVELYPKYAEAWFALGQMHEALEAPEKARDCYHKSLDADQKYMQPHMKLAMLDARTAKWQDVADRTGQVLKMNPYDFPDAYYLNSMANLNLKHLDKAEDSARKAIEMNAVRRFPQVEQILGLVLAYQNNYGEASKHLRRYLELAPNAGNAALVKQQIEEMESFQQQALEAAPGSPAPEQK